MDERMQEIIDFFEQGEGYSKQDVITDILSEISSLKGISADEIGLEWDEKLTTLDDFTNEFYDKVIEKVCNVIKSFGA